MKCLFLGMVSIGFCQFLTGVASAQLGMFSPEQRIAITADWKGERTPDGRPLVPEAILERMKTVSAEEAWEVLKGAKYERQFEGGWKVIHPGKRPVGRVVTGPGYFNLGDNQRLQVERTRSGYRRTNKATIQFFSSAPKADPPGKPYEIVLPDGLLTYAIAWERGAGVLWIKQKGIVRSYDFTNPAQVKEMTFREPANLEKVPKPILDALPDVRDVPSAPPAASAPR